MRKNQLKKILFCFFLVSPLIFQVCGCGKTNQEADQGSGVQEGENSVNSAGNASLSDEDLFLSLADLPWRDNSLDVYSAVINVPLLYTDGQESFITYVLGNTRASGYDWHISDENGDRWDDIQAVTDQGVKNSFRFDFGKEEFGLIQRIGGVAGSDHYLIMGQIETDEDGGLLYRFYELDQDMQVVNSFYVDCLDRNDYELPQFEMLQADARGNLHMVTKRSSDSTWHYYIVAPDGKLLQDASPTGGFTADRIRKLLALYDGRVGIQLETQLQCVNLETGETEVLANIKPNYLGCTLLDEKTMLYADSTGIYRSGLSGENAEIVYTWNNHGILTSEIKALQVTESGDISLIYIDSRGANYLKLIPTTEKVEIQEIIFGISQGASRKYQAAVAAFNKKYPAYCIKIKNYGYGDSSLLTQLAAGKGPVLVDTMLVDFKNNAEWWEPLDEVFRQTGMEEELIPKVVDAGRIDGTLYGVVTDFSLDTVITFAEEPEEWEYDAFLNCFDENASSVKSVYTPLNGTDGFTFISSFFYHGLQEKYLFDADKCVTYFDSEKFRKILRLGRYYMVKEHQGTSEGLREGTTMCAAINIKAPEEMAYFRIWGGDKLRFIGYPSGGGSRHYISCGAPITIRANATAEEKWLARSFLQYLLSYDAQTEAVLAGPGSNYHMSVRKDILQEQINRMGTEMYSYPSVNGFPQYDMGDQVDIELDGAALYELLEKAEPKQYMQKELSSILNEELEAYLEGNLTEDILIEHLENRVELYLSEQK